MIKQDDDTDLTIYDYIIFVFYFIVILSVGLFSSLFSFFSTKYKRWKQSRDQTQEINDAVTQPKPPSTTAEYFLAGRDMQWWAIGASLFSSNIGSEHFIGLAGTGAREGIAVCWFEWTGLFIILLLAYVFVPLYMESMIFTTPEFIGIFHYANLVL